MYCHINLGTKVLCLYDDSLFNTIVATNRSYFSLLFDYSRFDAIRVKCKTNIQNQRTDVIHYSQHLK